MHRQEDMRMPPRKDPQQKLYHHYKYNMASHYAQYYKEAQQEHNSWVRATYKMRYGRPRSWRWPLTLAFSAVIAAIFQIGGWPSASESFVTKMRPVEVETKRDDGKVGIADKDGDDISLLQMNTHVRNRHSPYSKQGMMLLKLAADACIIAVFCLAIQTVGTKYLGDIIPAFSSPEKKSMQTKKEQPEVCKRYNMGVCNTNHHRCKFAHYCMVCNDVNARHRAFSRGCPFAACQPSGIGAGPPAEFARKRNAPLERDHPRGSEPRSPRSHQVPDLVPPIHRMPQGPPTDDYDRRAHGDYSWDPAKDSMIQGGNWSVQGERDGKLYWRGPPEGRPRPEGRGYMRPRESSPNGQQKPWPGQSAYAERIQKGDGNSNVY